MLLHTVHKISVHTSELIEAAALAIGGGTRKQDHIRAYRSSSIGIWRRHKKAGSNTICTIDFTSQANLSISTKKKNFSISGEAFQFIKN